LSAKESAEQVTPASLSFLGRSVLLNALFVTEAGANFLLDIAIAAVFGLSAHSDAFYAAWMLPQTVGRGMFQSLTNSFMGLFADQEDCAIIYNQAITVIAVMSLPLAALFSAASAWWLPLTIPAAAPETRLVAIPLAGVLAWLISFLALVETFRAIYYREGRWWLPSLAHLVGGLVAVGLVLGAGRERNMLLAAWGVTAGAGLEALLNFVGLRWLLGLRYRPLWPERGRLMEMGTAVGAPLTGQGVLVLAGAVERALASLLPPGSITVVTYANHIINTLERFAFRGFVITTIHMYPSEGKTDLHAHFRLVTLIALPISIIFAVLSRPLVAVVFGRGRFTVEDVQTLALAIQIYAPAILGIALTRIPFGLAYARKKAGVVFGFFTLDSVVLVLAEALFIHLGLGLRAFGLSYTLAMGLAFAWLYWSVLRPQRQRIYSWADSVRLLAVGLSAWVGTALPASLAKWGVVGVRWADWLTLFIGAGGCSVFLIATAYVLKLDEARQLLQIVKGRHR
jgi:putative peptidoglycan lipid II flippase